MNNICGENFCGMLYLGECDTLIFHGFVNDSQVAMFVKVLSLKSLSLAVKYLYWKICVIELAKW